MNGQNCSSSTNSHLAQQVIAGDSEFVASAQAGSSSAFAELYALYSRRLYKTIFAITKHREDTEDALQETFMRACLAIHTFESRSTIYSWLTRIAINSAQIVLRKRRVRREICLDPQSEGAIEVTPLEVKDSAPNPEQICDLNQRYVILMRAVGNLRTSLRGSIQMRIETDSSLKEIGQRFNLSEGAVKARLYRARARLSSVVDGATSNGTVRSVVGSHANAADRVSSGRTMRLPRTSRAAG
jgi:RNA polymerase sigma-70 factor, ECF subfamily